MRKTAGRYIIGGERKAFRPSSFEYLGGGYGKDPWKVVYQGREVPGASSSSFEELGWGYARDAWKVYYCGEVIPVLPRRRSVFRTGGNGDLALYMGLFFAGSPFLAVPRGDSGTVFVFAG